MQRSANLSLAQNLLILIAAPLLFEVGLLVVLYVLLDKAEQEADRADRANRVIAQAKETGQLLYDVGLAFVIYDAKTKYIFERRLSELMSRIPLEIESLSDLVRTNPKHLNIVKDVSAEVQSAVSTLLVRKEAIAAGGNLDFTEAMRLRGILNRSVRLLDVIIREERASLQNDPQAVARLKWQVKLLLIAGVVASLLLAALLGVIFHRGTTRRLARLMDNSLRLGQGAVLAAPLEGKDELARLDRVFHDAADKLREAARKERAVIENAVDVICSIDSSGRFTAVSPASSQLWGFTPEELLNSEWTGIVAESDRNRCKVWEASMQTQEHAGQLENKVRRKDGNLIDMLWSAHWSAKEQALFCVAHDITERKELERFKQEFVAMISHDLRTPLAAVQSTLAVLERGAWGDLSEKGHSKVQAAESNITRSIELINNLLDLEKLESGKMQMHLQTVELGPLLTRCYESILPLAEKKSIQVNVPATTCSILADPLRISQVIINLLGNAVKFSPQSSDVSVTLEQIGNELRVAVTDKGPGIPATQLPFVFDRYHQVTAPGEQAKEGSGLGLTICKAIVAAHGGEIGVESREGAGATFWFTLPVVGAHELTQP